MTVSIHAPAWGATVCDVRKLAIREVSIHAPAWGATVLSVQTLRRATSFNPRARVGRDHGIEVVRVSKRVSIHAPAWGATLGGALGNLLFGGFNPRARVGRDSGANRKFVAAVRVSIHAPAWGATSRYVTTSGDPPSFQSTRPRGARRYQHNRMTRFKKSGEVRDPEWAGGRRKRMKARWYWSLLWKQ